MTSLKDFDKPINRGRRPNKPRLPGPAGIFLAVFLLVFILSWLARVLLMPVDAVHAREIAVAIPKHAVTSQIADILQESGLIRSALVFRIYARFNHVDDKFRPGQYAMNTAMSLPKIVDMLIIGPPDRIKITIPEGYTVAQIGELLEQQGVVARADFERALNKTWTYPFLEHVPYSRYGFDGYLYPDTYILGSGSGPDKIVNMMLQRFEDVIKEHDYQRQAASLGLTLHQAVTIASMVEREARVAEERPTIAGVIHNRLKIGMMLQIDATVQYALGKQKEKLYNRDLEIDSPYNTYKINGLPPGPIANPGWPSLQAAVQPEKHNYLYYVAKPDGTHAFARTLSEHNQNIKRYQ